MDEITYTNFSLGTQTQYGQFAVGFMRSDSSEIPSTFVTDEGFHGVDYYYDYARTTYKVGFQKVLSNGISVGVTPVYYSLNFDDVSGGGYNLDAGALWNSGPREWSFFARNVFPRMMVKYNDGNTELLPRQYNLSFKQAFKGVYIYPQIKYSQKHFLQSIGLSYTPYFMSFLDFEWGYKQHLSVTAQRHHNASFGIGLHLLNLHCYFAYERSNYVLRDNKTYFSLHTDF